MKSHDELYQQWLEQRRKTRPDAELTDRVMSAVARAESSRPASRLVLLLMWIDRSRARRFAACAGALAAGSAPFIYLAYISRAFVS
jgi:hypothetical protein